MCVVACYPLLRCIKGMWLKGNQILKTLKRNLQKGVAALARPTTTQKILFCFLWILLLSGFEQSPFAASDSGLAM